MVSNDYIGNLRGALVLVTGATGFTGQVLVRKLLAQGARVRVIARSTSQLGELAGLDIEWFRGEVFDPLTIREATKGAQHVFHVAAAYREAKISDEVHRNVHVASTQELCRTLVGAPQFTRFVHVSTVGVHGHIDEPPANEEYRFAPGDVYQSTKADAEQWLRDFAKEHNFPYAIVRPAAIYGPGDRRLLKLFKMARWPIFPQFGGGKGLYHLIHVEDLCDAMMLVATHPGAAGEAFIVGNDQASERQRMVKTIADEIGNKSLRFVRMPIAPLFWLATMCEVTCKPFGIEPPLYRRRVAFFSKDRSFDTSKIRERLGFRQSFSSEEGLRGTARWYRAQGWM